MVASLKPVAGKPNTFSASADVFPHSRRADGGVTLQPFYKIYGTRRYEVYWDRFTPEQWQAKEAEYRAELAKQKEFEARTVDSVNIGEEQNERDHNMKGEKMDTRDFNDRIFRFADTNGWFSWELKVLPGQPQELDVYFGGGGRGGARGGNPPAMEVYVDDVKIATERMAGGGRPVNAPKSYPLSADLLKGKNKITVKFQAPPDSRAGSVYGVRVLKAATDTNAGK